MQEKEMYNKPERNSSYLLRHWKIQRNEAQGSKAQETAKF